MTDCPRCHPQRPCINCETQERSAAFLRGREARLWLYENVNRAFEEIEALARGRIRYERNSKQARGWA
jgi:hypothetical protein